MTLLALEPELTVIERSELERHEATIERGLQTFVDVGKALMAIRDGRLYRESHGTFEDYCNERWNIGSSRARQLIDAAKVFDNLQSVTQVTPEHEKQARPLIGLSPELQRIAWQEVVDTAEDNKITTKHVETVVSKFKAPAEPPAPDRVIDAVTGEIFTDEPLPDVPESTGRQKPKINRAGNAYEPQGFDACQTPAYAIDPLLPYLNRDWTIWEPARGEGLLVDALYDGSFYTVLVSDLLTGQNFFEYEPAEQWDCLVTNPPYSIKYRWLERCYQLGKPFALLLPVETLGAKSAQIFFRTAGIEVIFLDRRVNFKMPNIGWQGSAAQFPVAWFTYGLKIGQQMTFAELTRND
jgi:hypothetical protein